MAEPISLDEAKAQCRVTSSDEDDLIGGLIVAAREWVEGQTAHILVQRAMTRTFACFAEVSLSEYPIDPDAGFDLAYLDTDGETQVFEDFRPIVTQRPCHMALVPDATWPAIYSVADAVQVAFTAGYVDATEVPQALKAAMLMLIEQWYGTRSAAVIGQISEVPFAVEALTRPYRLPII